MSKSQQKSAEEILRLLEGIKEKKGEGGISTLPTRRPVDQEKAGAMLGDLEFRSDIAPFLESNPVAKLGFKLFEDDKLELVGIPTDKRTDSKKVEKLYEATPKFQGLRGLYFKDEASVDSDMEKNFLKNLQKYGMETPEFPEYGLATYAFMRDVLPPELTRRTIAHELAHAGMEYLVRNMDKFSEEDQGYIKSATMFGDRRSVPTEEKMIDRMEYETQTTEPSAKIDFEKSVDRVKKLTKNNPFVKYVENKTPEFIKNRVEQERPPFFTARMEGLYDIAEKELRKMNVPEKQGQLGFFDKVQRYFEGVF